jgi:hypothetical protein
MNKNTQLAWVKKPESSRRKEDIPANKPDCPLFSFKRNFFLQNASIFLCSLSDKLAGDKPLRREQISHRGGK